MEATPSVFSRSASGGVFAGATDDCIARDRIAGKIVKIAKEIKPPASQIQNRKPFFMDTIEESSFRTRNGKQTQFPS